MRIVPALLVVTAVACAGCGATGGGGDAGGGARERTVVTAFYPLAWAADAVGGSSVSVRNLTPPGSEPHDIELTPREVAELQRADVVLYLSHGFQPAVEQAVDEAAGTRVDVLGGLPLREGSGGIDPHVWLDPRLFARVLRRVGAALDAPARARRVARRVSALDSVYRRGLARCSRRDFVTTHAAFGYLAARYGLRQIAITGTDPESEPSPRALSDLVRLVRQRAIHTVFVERLVSPRLADTVARETGAHVAVLDPIEGLTPAEAARGADYLSLMRQNLAQLRSALGCR